jgi:HAD superfamily hydrolase (TIGR01662 family)
VGIITNQPDISRGLLRRSELKKMNDAIIRAARKAGIGPERMTIKVCPHTNEDDCDCRKPKTGLIDRVMKEFGLRPGTTRFYIIGDKLTDLQTLENYYRQELLPRGIPRKSMTTILLEWEYGDQSSERRFMTVGNARVVPDFRLGSLESAVNLIMGLERGGPERKS